MSEPADILFRQAGARGEAVLDTLVIGAGHSGLAVSRLLAARGIRHVVLERGEVADAWRKRRWDSLRLLTPNKLTRLPGFAYAGDDPDGFMRVADLVALLEEYARGAPVVTRAEVTAVRRDGDAWCVASTRGTWRARTVVLASGAAALPCVPSFASRVPADVAQLTPLDYRSPEQVAPGGVLVVGASATGLQFADELVRAGREVTLAVGEHVRMPRHYRGLDIVEWLVRAGISDERYDDIDDINRGRDLPSPQLVGDRTRPILDLNSLTDAGVTIAGRLMGVRDGVALFSGGLRNACALADLKLRRLLDAIDASAVNGPALPAAERFEPTRVPAKPPLALSLGDARTVTKSGPGTGTTSVSTIIWATGYRPDFSWLDAPVFDRKGRLVHDGGIVAAPGLYVMGLPLMRRRKSSFIFGAEDDARDITAHLADFLARTSGRKSATATRVSVWASSRPYGRSYGRCAKPA
ncbi:MAG TPA: NAD(P)/FAD-dependent oxidoreductase [Woeseiaceae bacterium]|nr:NAD(P)/FAD-dependent oxidoreductase [Woeseiaceae bacterium]